MPGLNQTGPMGEGPRTGRKMGVCGNSRRAEDVSPEGVPFGTGRGMRRGCGMGPGRGMGSGRGMGRRRGMGNNG